MAQNELVATIFDRRNRAIARIALNGYNIRAGGPLGISGAMRSFRVLQGADGLWDFWQLQDPFVVMAEDGKSARARVAAYPAEENGFGFIEFL